MAGFNIIATSQNKANRSNRLSQIASLITDAQGRNRIAASMAEPLREFRDHQGIGRRAFQIDELGQGEIAYYDKDVDTPSFIVAEEGSDVNVVIRGERVFVPLFEIATLLKIPITQIRERRYDLTTRVKEKARSEIIKTEDKYIFGTMEKIASDPSAVNSTITSAAKDLCVDHISEAKAEIERHGDVNAANLFINPKHEVLFRKMNKDRFIDFETTKQILNTGYIGRIYNMEIHKSAVVPENKMFMTAEPEFFGKLVVGQDITVLNADTPETRQIGFSLYEQIGLLVHNNKGLIQIEITG